MHNLIMGQLTRNAINDIDNANKELAQNFAFFVSNDCFPAMASWQEFRTLFFEDTFFQRSFFFSSFKSHFTRWLFGQETSFFVVLQKLAKSEKVRAKSPNELKKTSFSRWISSEQQSSLKKSFYETL